MEIIYVSRGKRQPDKGRLCQRKIPHLSLSHGFAVTPGLLQGNHCFPLICLSPGHIIVKLDFLSVNPAGLVRRGLVLLKNSREVI